MEHILSLSYGKDSLACLGAIEKLGLPLDKIIHAEIWATDTIPADLPPMIEFKEKADKIIRERYGLTVEHVRSDKTASDIFYAKRKRGNRVGEIIGFPMAGACEFQKPLKVFPINKVQKDCITYVGIAYDEPKRFKSASDTKIFPLVKAEWTEKVCYDWCKKNDLLSPIYSTSARGGCWFCPNQSIDQLRLLRRDYPEYWQMLLKWDNDSPVLFKPSHSVHDYDRRFRLEDMGLIYPNDRRFRWEWVTSYFEKY